MSFFIKLLGLWSVLISFQVPAQAVQTGLFSGDGMVNFNKPNCCEPCGECARLREAARNKNPYSGLLGGVLNGVAPPDARTGN